MSQNATLPPPIDYRDRVYAGWLGKCIGVRLGAPIENWTHDDIRNNLGEIDGFFPLPLGSIFKPDDDTAFPMLMIRALEDYGPNVTARQMGDTVLNYLADQRGTFWWGGYGVSTEHTAYLNLANGIFAPRSGSAEQNGKIVADQIGGQIFSDIWGLVAPNNPELAADYAAKASSVTHDGEGINGGRFIAGLVSLAFSETDPRRLIEGGLVLVPADSEYARVVNAMLDFHAQHPDDWRAAYYHLAANFGYDRYGGVVHIIPNAGVVAIGLLYSHGDFSRSIQIAAMAGWDTDCNVGNVGAIMGVAVGLDGIDFDKWRAPMNDMLVASGVIGVRNLLDMPACTDLFHRLGMQIAGDVSPEDAGQLTDLQLPLPRYHFDFPGSTQGFQSWTSRATVFSLRQFTTADARTGRGVLRATVRKLNKKGEVRLFVDTYIREARLSANHYKASFSPTIHPGQTLTAQLFLPADQPQRLRASLYVWDDNNQRIIQGVGQVLTPGEWHTLRYEIPAMENALLAQAGIAIRTIADEPWSGSIWLDSLDWSGPPNFLTDFSREQPEQDAISQWTFSRGYWRLEGGAFHGSSATRAESYTGDIAWRDLLLVVDMTPIIGEHHNVNFRVQGTCRSYAVGLAPDGQVVLYKATSDRTDDPLLGPYRPLVHANFPWQHNTRYRFFIQIEGPAISVSIAPVDADGGQGMGTARPVFFWTDPQPAYLHGQIGFSNFGGSHTRYQRMVVNGKRA